MRTVLIVMSIVVVSCAILGGAWFMSNQKPLPASESMKPFVVTTMYPLAFLAGQLGGGDVAVYNATPAGAEPHDFEPTPRDVARMSEADVMIMNGAGIDAWAEPIAEAVRARGGKVVILSEALPFASIAEHEDEHGGEVAEHEHGDIDPHMWLDPTFMQRSAVEISRVLQEVDPERATVYLQREGMLRSQLNVLDGTYETGLSTCAERNVVVAHDAFGYLGRRYNLTMHPIAGISPDAEPSAQGLATLAEEARELGVSTIFFETLVSPRLAETLAREIGAKTAVLNPLEGLTEEEIQTGQDYYSIMRSNLSALRTALMCP